MASYCPKGIVTSTSVPRPGADLTWSVPPKASARSRMPTNPMTRSPRRVRTSVTSKPAPLSRREPRTRWSVCWILIHTRVASASLAALVSWQESAYRPGEDRDEERRPPPRSNKVPPIGIPVDVSMQEHAFHVAHAQSRHRLVARVECRQANSCSIYNDQGSLVKKFPRDLSWIRGPDHPQPSTRESSPTSHT